MNNKVNIGLDVSTKTIGICLMDFEGNLLKLCQISPKADKLISNEHYVLYEKYNQFESYFIENYHNQFDIDNIFIEAPLMMSNNVMTVNKLIEFNALVSYGLYKLGHKPTHVSEYEARKLFFPEYVREVKEKGEIKFKLSYPKDSDKKELVLKKVETLEPQLIWDKDKKLQHMKHNYDMADAYVVCSSGLQLLGIKK